MGRTAESVRQTFLPFSLPDIDSLELAEVKDVLESGWVTLGPKTRQFEIEFAHAIGAKHAIAVNSCTAAMHLALEAIGVRPGEIVLTSPYTFAATAEVIRYFDALPLFVDIEPDTLNLSPQELRDRLENLPEGKRAVAVIPVHIGGHPCDMEAITQIAHEYQLGIVEDAAHALPAKYRGRNIGSFSGVPADPSLACFSFYATKSMTTGEGGMITTNDDALAERCRLMALHGISQDAWKRYMADGAWYYEILAPGYKYNMNDIAAAMGIAQLKKLRRMWRRRKEIAARYSEAFSRIPELEVPTLRSEVEHAWHLYILRLHPSRLRISRNRFIEELNAHKIGTSVHFIPLHLHPYYRETYHLRPEDYPVAYREYQRAISLPIYSKMSDEDVQDVISAVEEIVTESVQNSVLGHHDQTSL